MTEQSATTDVEIVARSSASPDPSRPPVTIEPLTGFTDEDAAPTVVDSDEKPTQDSAMGSGRIGSDSAPINVGVLDAAAAAARYGSVADAGLTTLNTEIGDPIVTTLLTADIGEVGVAGGSGGVAGEGVPSMGSVTGLPSASGPGNVTSGGSETPTAAPVPEAATFVLVVFPLLAALIVRLRG
jgi:hypothetical protein